ncbi:MAG: hypothetical protein DRG59_13385 [Deltaproteobacteria bacterium]|nr:MAG: hypothetical protein DRG59_13385 [Deltaproteobacteria bacterium]
MGPRNEEVNDQIAFIPASAIKMAREILLLCRLISSSIEAIEKFSQMQLKSSSVHADSRVKSLTPVELLKEQGDNRVLEAIFYC